MRNALMYPRQSPTTHTEQPGDEASVYDWARAQVHALNPTAARVWRLCDGATSPDAIAAALRVETGVIEAAAVVDLTLRQLARVHLLELPVERTAVDRPQPGVGCSVMGCTTASLAIKLLMRSRPEGRHYDRG